MKQLTLFSGSKREFGGSLSVGKRKSARPLSIKAPIHFILKGDTKYSGSLLKHRAVISEEINKYASRFGVKVLSYAIVGNHIHFSILVPSREAYNNFVRVLSGQLAQKTEIRWTLRPYTKLVSWAGHQNLAAYIQQNHEEAVGIRPYLPRKKAAAT